MKTISWAGSWFILGVISTILFCRSCIPVAKCPEYITTGIVVDTTHKKITGGGSMVVVPVRPVRARGLVNSPNATQKNLGDTTQQAQPDSFCQDSIYQGNYSDSSICITTNYFVDPYTCCVKGFDVKYYLTYPEVHTTVYQTPTAVSNDNSYYLTAEPGTNGIRSGIGLGLLKLQKKTLTGFSVDPFLQEVRIRIGYRIW